jgi:hypothetical protein
LLENNRANLYFFTVESMGAFGKEAIELCKLLAESPIEDERCSSVSLQRIYQRLSVGITANIECQVETLRRLP